MHSLCNLCDWRSPDWPTLDQAGFDATWHVYRAHPEHWRSFMGDRAPIDPDPRAGL